MKPVVLLGAGASADAGVPAVFAMTERVRAHIKGLRDDALGAAFDLVAGGLQMTSSQAKLGQVDIEQVLTVTTLLANRSRTDLAPFVAAWHPLVASLDRAMPNKRPFERISIAVREMFEQFQTNLERGERRLSAPDLGQLDDALNQLSNEIGSRQQPGILFRLLALHIYAAIVQLTWLEANDEAKHLTTYLSPLPRAALKEPIVVATLNYDNAVERSALFNGAPVSTGLTGWSTERRIVPPQSGIELLKLHGSANWVWDRSGTNINEIPEDEIPKLKESAKASAGWSASLGGSLAIILGGDNKLTAKGPFLDLLTRFKSALMASEKLLVVGYSFRDDHINHVVMNWLIARPSARVVIVGRKGGENENAWRIRIAQHSAAHGIAFAFSGERFEYHPIGAEAGLTRFLV